MRALAPPCTAMEQRTSATPHGARAPHPHTSPPCNYTREARGRTQSPLRRAARRRGQRRTSRAPSGAASTRSEGAQTHHMHPRPAPDSLYRVRRHARITLARRLAELSSRATLRGRQPPPQGNTMRRSPVAITPDQGPTHCSGVGSGARWTLGGRGRRALPTGSSHAAKCIEAMEMRRSEMEMRGSDAQASPVATMTVHDTRCCRSARPRGAISIFSRPMPARSRG